MTPYKATASHYSNVPEENGVSCSFSSMDQLIEDIKTNSSGLFEALLLCREINEMNGYEIVGRYEIAKLKKHFTKMKSQKENVHLIEYDSSKIKVDSIQPYSDSNLSFYKNQNRGFIKATQSECGIVNTENHFLQNESPLSQKDITHSKKNKYKELQKQYMKLLSI